jgi:hypothetical protein
LLFGSLFFLISNQGSQSITPATTTTASNPPIQRTTPAIKEEQQPSNKLIQEAPITQEQTVAVPSNKIQRTTVQQLVPVNKDSKEGVVPVHNNETLTAQQSIEKRREIITFDASRFTQGTEIPVDAVVVNKTITYNAVTSNLTPRITDEDTLIDTADPSGDFKNTKKNSAKGFFRKVSRFIERNTGIGTANSDEQTLIGAVALKLK